jgi:2-succinyl-6-hydroxy-2,4-cyclohexadiene-1-carboxylate synthase
VREGGVGPGDRTPVLALHGFTGRGSDFRPLLEGLERPWDAPDLPGHGPVPVEGIPDMDAVVRGMEAHVETLGWEAFVVLGYSFGGRVALAWATRQPRGLAGLVCVGATAGLADPVERRERVEADLHLSNRIESMGATAFLREWRCHPMVQSQGRIAPGIAERMQKGRTEHLASGLAASLRGAGTGAMDSLWEELPRIQVPTLLLAGEEDRKFLDIAQEMVHRIPLARTATIPGAGHCAHLEAPAAFGRMLTEFLSFVDGERGPYTGPS